MRSSETISLFGTPPPSRRGPSSVVISLVLHGLSIALVALGLRHAQSGIVRPAPQRLTVRLLNLHSPPPQMHWHALGDGPAPGQAAAHSVQAAAHSVESGSASAASPALRIRAEAPPELRTLLQPDVPPDLVLPKDVTVPLVVMWAPELSPAQKIVPPPPQNRSLATVRPSLTTPNREPRLADLKISATAFATPIPTLPPSTTTPLTVRGPAPARPVPQTNSRPAGPPMPARVIALSELQMPEGTIALPPANQATVVSSSGSLSSAHAENDAAGGSGKRAGTGDGSGAGSSVGSRGETAGTAGEVAGIHGAGSLDGQNAGRGTGSVTGSGVTGAGVTGAGISPAIEHITLPRSGQFGVVVVGSSIAEQYPETAEIWTGRLSYSVYLHVGAAKNWVLQYSLPRAQETTAAVGSFRPVAPWPYDIYRPRLAPGDVNANALMVHGFVNEIGRFEQLAVVFPPQFEQAKFVLGALEQWHFRPATQNGRSTAVEVLLIIPDEQPE